jgi:Flp pilus assembly protein TadG
MKNIHSSLTKRTNADGRGQVMIEFALVLPVLVLLLLGTIDLARAVYAYGVISNAARDGAHWASLRPVLPITFSTYDKEHGDLDTAAVEARAKANAKTLEEDRIDVKVQCFPVDDNPYMQQYTTAGEKDMHKCDSWNWVTVNVGYEFQPITIFFSRFWLKSWSKMTIE